MIIAGKTFALICFVILLFFCSPYASTVFGQSASPSLPSTNSKPLADQSVIEIGILKAQLQEMRSHDSDLLVTVLWALGGVVSVTVLLAGINGFISIRVYDRDKLAMQRDLRSFVDIELSASKLKSLEEVRSFQAQVSADLKTNQDLTLTSIEKSTKAQITSLGDVLQNKIGVLSEDLMSAQYDLQKMEADNWVGKKAFNNAFRCHIDMLKLSVKLDNQYMLGRDLESLINDIRYGAEPDTYYIGSFMDVINEFSEEMSDHNSLHIEALKLALSPSIDPLS